METAEGHDLAAALLKAQLPHEVHWEVRMHVVCVSRDDFERYKRLCHQKRPLSRPFEDYSTMEARYMDAPLRISPFLRDGEVEIICPTEHGFR